MPGNKRPLSVLVVIHTPELVVLLLERVAPSGFWQSVTGSLEAGESWRETALREIQEETGLHAEAASLVDWHLENRYPIPAVFLARYPAGTTHNVERVFSYCVASPFTPRPSPREHSQALWLPWPEALARCTSWTNRDAIRLLIRSHAGVA
jgi:dihydroneopterin triphosphate diphosphatase